MCLIAIGWKLREDYPLILAANRDEFFSRPAAPADFWQDHDEILAGRDLLQGGTWLGLTRSGRLAAVTNYRDALRGKTGMHSRGWLVRDYLLSEQPPGAFLTQVRAAAGQYDGFNLIAGTRSALFHYSNRGAEVTALPPGAHGLSNHLLNTPWPKVERARQGLTALADAPAAVLPAGLFALLADRMPAPDGALPDTGVGLEWERVLSTAFIQTDGYGTRCSTVLLVDRAGHARFEERTFAADGTIVAHRRHDLQLTETPRTRFG
jgi:uncharacterized protein with NRDE domain